jgi:hypothetical protein
MKLLALILLVFPFFVEALEIDEKLTVRILSTSETKKTVMINRGTEDGLVEGDHARFIVTAGIVARGVCIRVSPARSVWAIYRLVNADFIVTDSVMTIKISPPVKVTRDDSQALVQDDTPTRATVGAAPLGIPLADGAQDVDPGQDRFSGDDLRVLEAETRATSIPERNVEILGQIHISGLSGHSAPQAGGMAFSNSHSYYHIGMGGEWYAHREREWYSRISLVGMVNLMRENAQAYNGLSVTNAATELSFGLNWHPLVMPSATYRFIPFVHASMNFGTHRSDFVQGTVNPTAEPEVATGNSNGFALGLGYKFFTHNGFGVRAMFDYYRRVETYQTDGIVPTVRTLAGPRLMLALSYRF